MGFFDRIRSRRTEPTPANPSSPTPSENAPGTAPSPAPGTRPDAALSAAPGLTAAATSGPTPAAVPSPASAPAPNTAPQSPTGASVAGTLLAARERLDARDLAGALALYEPLLASAGDRADVLVTISGDLGSTGHVATIIELIAPRYDAERHGPATGLNLLQAYLATRNPTAARHLLDILFGLGRPELEERLHGFSNALADLIEAESPGMIPSSSPTDAGGPGGAAAPAPSAGTHINLVTISQPIWFYGLEPISERILPAKGDRIRRVAFAQLALPGITDAAERARAPEDELGRLCRALPLWLAETFSFSPLYAPIGTLGVVDGAQHYAVFPAEWSTDNLRQLVETHSQPLDYIITGALRRVAGDTEVILRVWEVRKFRERKQFMARWNPATADTALAGLHEQIRLFMEWRGFPEGQGVAYTPPPSPSAWLEVLAASATCFLGDKGLLRPDHVAAVAPLFSTAAQTALGSESASLAWLTLQDRARRLSLDGADSGGALLVDSPVVGAARALLG